METKQWPGEDEAEESSNSGLPSARVSGSLNQGPGYLLLSVTGTGGKARTGRVRK